MPAWYDQPMMTQRRLPHISHDGARSTIQIAAETVRDALVAMLQWMEERQVTEVDAINISADPTGPGVIVFFYLER